MALPTITLVNLTAGDIDLTQLAVTVPASSSIVASDFNFTDQILNDDELQTELGIGNLRIDISGGGLSSSDTTKTLEQSRAIIKPIHDLDIKHNLSGAVAPIATDDEDAGYSVGSIWVDEVGDAAYICVDDTATAAVWNPMGGAATWAATLAAGEISGGTDAVMSVGDTFRGVDVSSGAGGALVIRGGATTDVGNVNGGDVTIDGGNYGGTFGGSRGGNVTITGGGAPAGFGPDGGSVNIYGGSPLSSGGTGGGINIRTGDAGTGGGNAAGGDLSISTGDAFGSNQAGTINMTAGDSLSFGAGAAINVTAGSCTGPSGTGGELNLTAGAGSEVGGNVNIKAGAKTVAFGSPINSGNVSIESGDIGVGAGWKTGNISIAVPQVTLPASTNAYGGSITITAGNTGISNQDGGSVDIQAGDTYGSNGRRGGDITLTCGIENNGNEFSLGGSVFMTPGTSGSGDPGQVFIQGTGSMAMLERASAASMFFYVPVAGYGRWWVRNDAPNVPMFTDDAGTDWVLNETGSTGLQEAYEAVNTIVTSAPEGIFSVTGTENITLSSSAGNTAVSGLNVSLTALGAAVGGDVTLTAASSSGLGNTGGDVLINAGGGNGLGFGGLTTISGGAGGATGIGGKSSVVGGLGGATSGTGGLAVIEGGSAFDGDGGGVSVTGKPGVGVSRTGGTVAITAGNSTSAIVGGSVLINGGQGGPTGSGGIVNVIGGAAGATGADGGKASLIGGAGGATSGTGGTAAVSGGVATDGDGGAVGIVGTPGVGVNRAGGVVNIDAGDSTGTTNGAAINITAGDGSTASTGGNVNIDGGLGRIGGDINITSGAPIGLLQAGDVNITAEKSGGAPGKIRLTTESDDVITAPVAINTQSGFVDQDAEHRTFASSDAITNGVTGQVVQDLGAITTNGHNLKVVLDVTATDSITDSNFVAYRFVGSFYRAGGTVFAVTAFEDTNFLAGTANWTSNISFSVAISGSTVRLELDNAGGSGTDNFNLAIGTMSVVQLGGRTA